MYVMLKDRRPKDRQLGFICHTELRRSPCLGLQWGKNNVQDEKSKCLVKRCLSWPYRQVFLILNVINDIHYLPAMSPLPTFFLEIKGG